MKLNAAQCAVKGKDFHIFIKKLIQLGLDLLLQTEKSRNSVSVLYNLELFCLFLRKIYIQIT